MSYQDNGEFYYINIKNKLNTFVETVRRDSGLNLQSSNVLAETFFAQFLNVLRGWELENANRWEQNAKGVDLIDREHKIVAQVSSKTTHEKIQSSLDKCVQKYKGYRFCFIAIADSLPDYRAFTVPEGIAFDQNTDILCAKSMLTELLRDTRDAEIDRKQALSELVDRYFEPEKGLLALYQYLNATLIRVREHHPSFTLMKPDEIDKRLFPGAVEMQRFETQGTQKGDETPRPVWERIRESWRGQENRSVVIEGEGGIGKTVTLLSPPADLPVPAVYIRLYEMVKNGECRDVTDWLNANMYGKAKEIDNLAMQRWDGGPSLLLLLDGVNEVPATQRSAVLGELTGWRETHHGAQLIIVSRPLDESWLFDKLGNPIRIKLEPLSEETALAYLRQYEQEPPTGGIPEGSVLRRPLFLTLYAKTGSITRQKEVDGYPLAFKDAKGPGGIIWNYLQRELLKYERRSQEETQSWVLRCAVACEYVLPEIAYDMLTRHAFTVTEYRVYELIDKAVKAFEPERLPLHLSDMWRCKRTKRRFPDLSSFELADFVLDDLDLLIPQPKREEEAEPLYAFPHQNFRDCLAGVYLVNAAEEIRDKELPEVWKRTPNHLALDYAAELMDGETAKNLWEANRILNPTEPAAVYAQLELHRRRAGEPMELNFSGMDLRGLSLTRYGSKGARDLVLFRRPELSESTRLDFDTFRGQGHINSVECVATTADGLAVSGSFDNTLRVWDLRSGACLHGLKGHTRAVNCVAATADGLAVSGSFDNTLRVWNINSGACLHELKGHTSTVNCVAVTVDGLAVSGSYDGSLRAWDLRAAVCLHELKGHTDSVSCVAVTADGRAVSGSYDNSLRVWDLRSGRCLHELKGHTNWVNCVAVTADGLAVSGSYDGSLRVWDLRTGDCLHELKGHTRAVNCIAATADGLAVSGSFDNTLRVWNINSGACLHELTGHSGRVRCVAVTADGLAVSGSFDNTLRVWDLRSGVCLHELKGHTSTVNCVAVTADGLAVSGSYDGSLRVWDLRSERCLHGLNGHIGSVSYVAVTLDGLAVSGAYDDTLRVWDLRSGACLDMLRILYEIDVSQMDFSCVDVKQSDLALLSVLWQNGAKIPE